MLAEILQSGDLRTAQEAARKLQALSSHFLNWAGKAETNTITVPTLPLFVHERLSTQAVLDTLKRHRRQRAARKFKGRRCPKKKYPRRCSPGLKKDT